jgi:uncharacterized paraquat-inducible protein A
MAQRYTHRHGRCRPCNLVFAWPNKGNSVRVADAFCPKCRKHLSRTATALLDTSKTPVLNVEERDIRFGFAEVQS